MARVWFVTGATSGFGEAVARRALAAGDHVVATGRQPEALRQLADEYPGQVIPMRLDVTDADAARTAMAQAVSEFGRVDIRDHLAAQLKELEQWQSLSESSDFPDDGPDTKDD